MRVPAARGVSARPPDADATPDSRPQRLSGSLPLRLLKRVVYSLLPLVVLICLLELVLWSIDLGDPDDRLSLSRGFDARAAYLIPSAEMPGGWLTNLSDGRWPETEIPPKGRRLRVLLFGGSNTQGFPEGHLEQSLNRRAPEPGYEVINLGRAGYGSERVRILVRQARVLEPDIVVIYSGHNEFVEMGFAMELRQQWRHPLLMQAGLLLSRLRTVNVMVSLAEKLAGDRGGQAPEPRLRGGGRDESFRDMNYEHTLVFYSVYRTNLRAMIRNAREGGAEVLLSTVVSNMLSPPISAVIDPAISPETRHELGRLNKHAAELMPERLVAGFIQKGRDTSVVRLRPGDWGSSLTSDELAERKAVAVERDPPRLRTLQGALAGGPHWTDPSLWLPKVEILLRTAAAFHERRLSPDEQRDLQAAAEMLERAVELAPDDPISNYRLACSLYLLGGNDARAVQLFRDAGRFDRAPTRGNDLINAIVKELAQEFPEVAFVDTEAAFCSDSPDGLIGYEVMLDNCHLHPAARPVLLDVLVPALLDLGERVTDARD